MRSPKDYLRPFRRNKRHRYFLAICLNFTVKVKLLMKLFNYKIRKIIIFFHIWVKIVYFSDAKIILDDGSKFDVHKILMARESGFFMGQFKQQQKQYHLHKVSTKTFEMVLDWIYGCKIQLNIIEAFKLLVVSDYLLLNNLKNMTSRFLKVIIFCFSTNPAPKKLKLELKVCIVFKVKDDQGERLPNTESCLKVRSRQICRGLPKIKFHGSIPKSRRRQFRIRQSCGVWFRLSIQL